MAFPQHGGCLCGDVRYALSEDPVTLYACHCTDCQSETGSAFALSMIVRAEALETTRGEPAEFGVELDDGRVKRGLHCPRCTAPLWGVNEPMGLANLQPGSLDDTGWLQPVGHIWTRSAQPWVVLPEDGLLFEQQPCDADWVDFARGVEGPLV